MNGLKFDETGRYLVTISRDKQLILWDYHRAISIATFQANCQVHAFDLSSGSRCVTYIPEGIADLAILKPNKALIEVLDGKVEPLIGLIQTQGIVGAFTSKKRKSTQMCALM